MSQQEIDRLFDTYSHENNDFEPVRMMNREDFAQAAAEIRRQVRQEALEDNRVELGVIELHPKPALRDDFYRVADDLRRAGCIVDVWLMDIQTVLKRHGYRMEVYRALITGKDKG